MLEILTLVLASTLNAALGIVVYRKNPKSATNRLFLMLTISFILWSSVNYESLHPTLISQLIWIRLVLFSASLLCLSVFLTFVTFPSQTLQGSPRIRRLAFLYTLLVMLLTLTPIVFKNLKIVHGKASPQPSFGIVFFVILVGALLGGGIWSLISKYVNAKNKLKMQYRYVLIGLASTFGLIFLTNFVLVVLFKNSTLVRLGPAYTLIFSGLLAYAIVKHRLFDIRRAAARGLAYLLTLGLLGALYSFAVFGITSILFGSTSKFDLSVRVVSTALALLLAFSFQKIKKFFDRLSNRVFYKDAYDPQYFLDNLNNILVSEVDLVPLLHKTIDEIVSNIKSSYCTFVINKTKYYEDRIVSINKNQIKLEDVNSYKEQIHKINQKIIVTDYLDDNQVELKDLLNNKNIALIGRLTPKLQSKSTEIGQLILGPKSSGDPYNDQDIQIVEIVSNELMIAIENALRFEEIQNFNLTLQQKVDDATKQLRRANQRLKDLDETKDDFISMASHQLRTPLTSIKGYTSMVLEGDAGKLNDNQRKLLQQAFFSSQRMVYLIADLLNVSRLKTGKFVIERSLANLADVVEQEISQLVETAKSKKLELKYDKPAKFPVLMLDETKTRQVIMNFVDNALYYTPAGGHIEVKLQDLPKTVELTVVDDGIGVPKEEQHHLFSKFYRAGNARKARPDGTGLGLFMAKKVVIAEGGSIIFHSEQGKGSTFGFSLPKKEAPPAES